MLKVFVITQDEPFYVPKMVEHLLNSCGSCFQIVGFTVLNPHRKNKNYWHWIRERAKVYNIFELCLSGCLFIFARFYNFFSKYSYYNVRAVFNKYKISEFVTNDINKYEYIDALKALEVDVVISISCPQLFNEALLSVAKFSINAHGTLLPRHRGVFGSWWTLFSGDIVGGSTIHTMELRLDAGEILWQKEFKVTPEDTQYSIAYKTKRDMAYGIVETLYKIFDNSIVKIEPRYKTSYHRAPTKEDGILFHKKGFKVISVRDIKYVLSKEFSNRL